MTPKCKSSDSRDLDRPEGSHKASPLNEKVKVLDLIRKGKKNQVLSLLRSTVRPNLSSVNLKKEKEIRVSFAQAHQTEKVQPQC